MSPLWHRKESAPQQPEQPGEAPDLALAEDQQTPAPPVVPEPEFPPGDKPCTRQGCTNQNGNNCSYVDRRARKCETSWCPEHRNVISDGIYCPRHAGIMKALLASSRKGHLPDIDNRAPSLANWIGNDIDERMRSVVEKLIIPDEGEQLIIDPVGYLYGMADKSHRWERSWKIANHTGVTIKAAIDVDEAKDNAVRLRVGQRTINEVVPPWVEHHEKRELVAPERDESERSAFYTALCDQLTEALMIERRGQSQRPYFGSNP
jgi:hypothetical protein